MAASAAHASQGGGGAFSWLPRSVQKMLLARDTFIREDFSTYHAVEYQLPAGTLKPYHTV